MVKVRGHLWDAPGVEVVWEAAEDGSDAHRPAACAESLITVTTEIGVDTSVRKTKSEKG